MAELHEIAILSPLPDMLATKFRDTEEIGAEGLPETTPKRKSVAKLVGHVRSLEKLADSPQDATKQENPDKKSSEGRRESESYEEAGAKQLEQFSVMEHSEGPGKVKKMEEERPDTIPSSERHKEREESAFAIEIKQSVNMLWMGHLSSTIVFDIRLNHQQNPIAFFEAMKREPSLVVVLEERCDKATAINPSLISGACVGSTASPWGRGNENRWKYVQFEFGAKCSPKAARHTRISNNDKKGSEIETAANGEMKICLCQNESHDYSYTVAVKVCQEYFFDLGGKKGTHPHPLRQGKELSLLVSVVDYMGTLVARARSRPVAAVEYGITMDENFYRSPYVMREEDDEDGTMFLFYNKKGGENASLDVVLYLRDSLGRIVTTLPQPIALDMSLVYHDGTPTPLMPKVPLKERRTSSSSNKPLFRPMRCATALGPGVGSVEFSFRIEEVSYHHRGKKGFKLQAAPKDLELAKWIYPGMLDEIVTVQSKPWKTTTECDIPTIEPCSLSKRSRPNCYFEASSASVIGSQKHDGIAKPRDDCVKRLTATGQVSSLLLCAPKLHFIRGCISRRGQCIFCSAKVSIANFFDAEKHQASCIFTRDLLPRFTEGIAVQPRKRYEKHVLREVSMSKENIQLTPLLVSHGFMSCASVMTSYKRETNFDRGGASFRKGVEGNCPSFSRF